MADAVQPCVTVLDSIVSGSVVDSQQSDEQPQSLLANILELLACLCEGSDMAVQRLSSGQVGSQALHAAAQVATASSASAVEKLAAAKLLHILAEDNVAVHEFMQAAAQQQQLLQLLQAASASCEGASQGQLAQQCHLLGFAGHIGAFTSAVGAELGQALTRVCSAVFSQLALFQGAEALRRSIEVTTAAAQAHAAAVKHNRTQQAGSASGAAAGAGTQDVEALQTALHAAQGDTHRARHSWSAKVQTAKLLSEVSANIAAHLSSAGSDLGPSLQASVEQAATQFHSATCDVLEQLPSLYTTAGAGAGQTLPVTARERILTLSGCMVSAVANLLHCCCGGGGGEGSTSAQLHARWWQAVVQATKTAAEHVPETQVFLDTVLNAMLSFLASGTAGDAMAPVTSEQVQLLLQLYNGMLTQQGAVLPSSVPTLISVLSQLAAVDAAAGGSSVLQSVVPLLLTASSSELPAMMVAALDGLVDVFSGDEQELNAFAKSLHTGQAMRTACERLQALVSSGAGSSLPEDVADQAEEVTENVAGLLEYKGGIIG